MEADEGRRRLQKDRIEGTIASSIFGEFGGD